MRAFLMILVGMAVFWSTEAQAESLTCWSSAVCYKAEKTDTEWLKVFPEPNCTSKSEISGNVEYIRIQQKFNRSIVDFFKDLGDFATNACSSCNSYQGIGVDDSRYTYADTEECFAPVICGVEKRTIADFIQIRPFPTCKYGKKEPNATFGEMESLFNSSRDFVVKELQHFLVENCNFCQTTRMETAIATLTKSLSKSSRETIQCYAPVICAEGDNSFENWIQFPDPDCKSAELILLSEKPDRIFTSILEKARAEIQDFVEEECNKPCNEKSPLSTSNFEVENTTTPQIVQRVSTMSADKGTTIAAPESMLQTSATSPITTLDIDECSDGNACHEYAYCTNFPSSYNCSCKAGFKGNGTLCTDIDECLKENSCHVYDNCTNFPSGYKCSCKAGFTGNGTLCTDVNECSVGSHNCNITANASCVNRIGGFTCTCDSGFTRNQTQCQDIDECTDGSNKCGEGGNCINIQGSYECACYPGFTGDGKQCSDIDECSDGNACHEDANCTNFPSRYNCSCKAGFKGNGTLCTDIDECSGENDCHEYGECANFQSSYNCSCRACFAGNGTFCTDIDECLNKESCHVDANCTNFPSGYNCSCRPGFTGNGRPCKDSTNKTCLATTMHDASIAGCAVLDESDINKCNIIYEGKCFFLWDSRVENVDLKKANETCALDGFHLGNIYDDCLYSHIKNQIGDVAAVLWTGMTVVFGEENHQVYLHSNKTAKFSPGWSNGFPKNDGNKYLQIHHKKKFIGGKLRLITGINNVAANAPAHGALCEKDVG